MLPLTMRSEAQDDGSPEKRGNSAMAARGVPILDDKENVMAQIDPALYQTLASYNQWMTVKLYAAAAKMDDSARKEDRGAFFKSVHSTLNHILFGDRAWMGRFTEVDYAVAGMGVDLYADFEELRGHHLAIAEDIVAFANSLTQEWLAGDLVWISSSDQVERTRPRWICVTHLFNHQTHHRGQISTLLSQAGIDIGVTDLPFMPGFE
ncbi:DinB family protein [Roseibium algae]|uniref:DinB family protein n=1 Tax=Roseibium algae TaxID=3123038 RepID=A0ABU8TQG9_9HYPH